MPACIRVESGIAVGSVLWIEKAVVRIGSDPAADLCLPTASLEPHALTVEFRDDTIRLYNRSSQTIFLGGQPVQAQQFMSWLDPDILELPDGLRLSLDQDAQREPEQANGEPAWLEPDLENTTTTNTATIPPLVRTGDSQPANPATASKSNSSSIWPQIAVTLLCIVMAIFLLARQQLKVRQASGSTQIGFNALVERTSSDSSPLPTPLIRHLQFAEAALSRGHRSIARQRFIELHRALQSGAANSDLDATLRRDVEAFIQQRLAKLN